jgi:gliding motility-associated protein GldE
MSDVNTSLFFWETLIIVLGLMFSALFSGSEVALFSSAQNFSQNRTQPDSAVQKRLAIMLEHPRRLLATILIGNTFANIITSVVAAVVTGEVAEAYGFPELTVYIVEIVVLTFIIIILSEITPKVIAIKKPVEFSERIATPIYFFYILLGPLSKLVANSALGIENRLPKPVSELSSEDIRTIAEVGEEQGSLKEDEREIFENVVEFGQTTVREIMTSRVNIVAVSTEDELGEVIDLIREKRLSRLPLYENDLDNIKGIIYAKDLLPYLKTDLQQTTINWTTIARKSMYVPSTKKLDDLLTDFKREKSHIAIVVDEYGGTEGIITLDDLLEEIVGDMVDETTEVEELFVQLSETEFIVDAKIDLDDLEDILDGEITTDEDEYETLGGLLYHLTERIPRKGEKVAFSNLEFTIHAVENNRIKKIKVKILKKEEE